MPKPKLVTPREVSPLDLAEVYDAADLNPALAKLYSEMGIDQDEGQARVYIMKVLNDNGKEARVWEGTPDEYNLMNVARRHGSGDYVVRVHGPHETGRMVLRGKSDFAIQLDAVEDARIKLQREGNINAMQPATPAVTPEAIVAAVVAAIKTAMPPPAPAISFKEMIEMAKAMQPPQPAMNPLELLKSVMSVARDADDERPARGGGANGFSLMERVVDKFGPLFAQTLASTAANMAAHPGVSQQPGVMLENPQNVEEQTAMQLARGIQYLVSKAKADADPALYADLVMDTVPENVLKEMVNDPAWLPKLKALVPEVENHVQWFTDLFSEIRALLVAEEPQPAADLTAGAETGKSA